MLWKTFIVALLISLAVSNRAASAGVVFTLSSPSNLSTLTVGQQVEIDLSLAGLPSPNNQTDFIFNLNTKVLFASSLFQPIADPTSASGLTATVAPGTVFNTPVQGPLQVANFNADGSSLGAGAATGIFSQSPNTNSGAIGLNGLYYSFILQATAVGSGTISFDPTAGANQYAANETGFNFAPLVTNGNLPFTISPAVPEPSSIALAILAIAMVGLTTRSRKRSATR